MRYLDILCPMHLIFDAEGQITHCGPTIARILNGSKGGVFDHFSIYRPRGIETVADLTKTLGTPLMVRVQGQKSTLKGIAVRADDGFVLNLSFGISVVDAVRDYALTARDFAVTDPTMELLYLIEAKSAAMDASRDLNRRLQIARIAAEEQAYTDTLTGLRNRRALDQILTRAVEVGQPFTLMHLDLDYFKAVNDTHGHAAGDHVLQTVARKMNGVVRMDDTVARIGGDEFVILLPDQTDTARAETIARRLIARLEEPIKYQNVMCQISGSVGIVLSTDYFAPSAEIILDHADQALYAAKHAGRGQHVLFREIQD